MKRNPRRLTYKAAFSAFDGIESAQTDIQGAGFQLEDSGIGPAPPGSSLARIIWPRSTGPFYIGLQVHGRLPAALLLNCEGNLLSLILAVQARALDPADVNEDILSAAIRLNESAAFCDVDNV